MHDILLTKTGYKKLEDELQELKGPIRKNIADTIREAKAHGDLKENAAYHEAKLNQTRLESRIADLEKVLQKAKIVEKQESKDGEAQLGSSIELFDKTFNEKMTVTLVGSYEADPVNNLVSITSPLGSSILGKFENSEITVEAPGGKQEYKILKITS